MTTSPLAPLEPPANFDTALMRFPFGQWIPTSTAAAHVKELGLPADELQLLIRLGKRRGVLRTRREPEKRQFYVMRVTESPTRTPTPA